MHLQKFRTTSPCSKCGLMVSGAVYHKEFGYECRHEFVVGEHLARRCERCGYEWAEAPLDGKETRPIVVCLCGSTRFYKAFIRSTIAETLAGKIVLSIAFFAESLEEMRHEILEIIEREKDKLDELHKRRIDIADEILVINLGGYIGDSTFQEIDYAKSQHKLIRYLEFS